MLMLQSWGKFKEKKKKMLPHVHNGTKRRSSVTCSNHNHLNVRWTGQRVAERRDTSISVQLHNKAGSVTVEYNERNLHNIFHMNERCNTRGGSLQFGWFNLVFPWNYKEVGVRQRDLSVLPGLGELMESQLSCRCLLFTQYVDDISGEGLHAGANFTSLNSANTMISLYFLSKI